MLYLFLFYYCIIYITHKHYTGCNSGIYRCVMPYLYFIGIRAGEGGEGGYIYILEVTF